ASVDAARPADGTAAGPLVWGIGHPGSGSDDARANAGNTQANTQDPQGDRATLEARLRAQFGSSVLIGADGRVTKQFFLAGDLGPTFPKLIAEIVPNQPITPTTIGEPPPGTKIGGANSRSILGRMLGGREIEVTYLKDFEVLSGAAIVEAQGVPGPRVTGAPLPQDANIATKVALVLATGEPSALASFEGALDLFCPSIPQIEITVQVIEYSNADALAFGVRPIDAVTPTLKNLSSNQLVQAYTSNFPLRQPLVGSSPVTDVGLFTFGGIHDSWQLNA